MNNKIRNIARTGYIAKGVIYSITGVLTFMTALNLGGKKAGKEEVLEFIQDQQLGNTLLVILAAGLLSYAIWRFTQALFDPEGQKFYKKEKNKKQRFALFISGIAYVGLAGLAILKAGGTSSSSHIKHEPFLNTVTGLWILGGVGLIFIGRGLYQIERIYKTKFRNKFEINPMENTRKRKIIKNAAYIGMGSRAIIFLIIGYFATKGAIMANPAHIKNTADAFKYIETSTYGSFLLGMVAIGLLGYAAYMFLSAKYRSF